jgi:serine carboxypeptidase-like clade 1
MVSIIFVDSPVGTGFSYARDPKGYDVGDVSASLQVMTFLRKVGKYIHQAQISIYTL